MQYCFVVLRMVMTNYKDDNNDDGQQEESVAKSVFKALHLFASWSDTHQLCSSLFRTKKPY